jgi:hypothetical protein
MLKKDLQEKDISSHTTICERIDKMAKDHLKELKEEMKVSLLFIFILAVKC